MTNRRPSTLFLVLAIYLGLLAGAARASPFRSMDGGAVRGPTERVMGVETHGAVGDGADVEALAPWAP